VARAGTARLPAPPPGEAATLADQAYVAIRHLIVTLELPPGAPIKEPELTERLGIGRTPVREALRRLALERLVAVYPRRGMEVTTVDVRDLVRLCEVRAVLEPEAARLAAERATRADLELIAELREELLDRRRPTDRFLIEIDERIHRAIYRATHNQLLEETLEWYYTHALRIWMLALGRTGELQSAVLEHLGLLDAISRGNGAAAAEVMHAHVLSFEDAMRDVLLKA
jgi:DNA-binding GntR family transcriptional regulator